MIKKIQYPASGTECLLDVGRSKVLLKCDHSGRLELFRDPLVFFPLFYFTELSFLVISSSFLELDGYLKEHSMLRDNDKGYIRSYLAFQAPDTSQTIRHSIRLLRPGERAYIGERAPRYSFALPEKMDTNTKFTSKCFSALLEDQIEALNIDDTCFHISSGLDSSILAIIAARVFGGKKVNLATCLTLGDGCVDELENTARLADELGANYTVYNFSDIDIFTEGSELISCLGYPIAHPSHLIEFMLDKKIKTSGKNCIVNGKGPDDCLGGYSWHLDSYTDAKKHLTRMTVTSEDELNMLLTHMPNVNTLDAWTFWKDKDVLSLNSRLSYDFRSLSEAWNIIHSAVSSYLRVEIVSPFMEPHIRRGLFTLVDNKKIHKGQQKVFLRDTFADLYPNYILNFPKTGMRLDLRPYMCRYDSKELYKLIVVDEYLASKYFDLTVIRHWITLTLSGKKNYGWQLWNIFCLLKSMGVASKSNVI